MPKPQPCNNMNAMRERDLVTKIITKLRKYPGVWVMKTHGSTYTPKGTPDIIGCVNGRFIAIEVKLDSQGAYKVTPAQKHVGNQVIKAGGTFTIMDCSNHMREIEQILTENAPGSI